MQPMTVGVDFFWIMLLFAFAFGIVVARILASDERRAARDKLLDAAALMDEVSDVLLDRRLPTVRLCMRLREFRRSARE